MHQYFWDTTLGWHEETGDRKNADRWLAVIGQAMNDAHIHAETVADLRCARWKKLVWNIPYNGLSVLHKTTTDVLMADPARRKHIEVLMREVQGLARACRCTIEDEFIRKMLDDTEKMRPYKTSMLLDYEADKPMEIEAMYERPLRAGEAAGAAAPNIFDVWNKLKVAQSR